MRRRDFIKGIVGPGAAWPLTARAQQAEGMAHVGMLGPNPDVMLASIASIGYRAFSAELQKLGFTQGKNLQLDYRRTDQGMDLAVAAARELVAAKSNIIVAIGPELSLRAALAPNSGLLRKLHEDQQKGSDTSSGQAIPPAPVGHRQPTAH